jgi:hypothetical protein
MPPFVFSPLNFTISTPKSLLPKFRQNKAKKCLFSHHEAIGGQLPAFLKTSLKNENRGRNDPVPVISFLFGLHA